MESAKIRGLRMGDYEVLGLIGLGGTAIVLAARDLRIEALLGANQLVALKVMFDAERARDEAERLTRMSGVHGVNAILDYLEIESSTLAAALRPVVQAWSRKSNNAIVFDTDRLAILVLHLERGETITKTRSWSNRDREALPNGQWLIETPEQKLIQYLRYDLSLAEKIALVQGLITAIENAHRLFGQVHGDLHPGNIMFNRETGDVVVIDWSNVSVAGADGWQSPWHDQFLLGEIDELPMAADIYQLGLWVLRLLAAEHPEWWRFAHRVLVVEDASSMPSIQVFAESFVHTLRQIERASTVKRAWTGLAIALLAVAALYLATIDWTSLRLRRSIHRIEAASLADPAQAQPGRARLTELLHDERYLNVKQDVIAALGTLSLRTPSEVDMAQRLDISRPSAVYYADDQSFLLYGKTVLSLGSAISESEFVHYIDTVGMVVASRDKRYRFIEFPPHALAQEVSGLGCLILYPSKLGDLLEALGSISRDEIDFSSTTEPRVFGVLKGDTVQVLLKKLFLLMDARWDENKLSLSYEKHWLRTWEVEPGYRLAGTYIDIVVENIGQKLGYPITDINTLPNPPKTLFQCASGTQMSNNVREVAFSVTLNLYFDPCDDSAIVSVVL